ncbi:uncharacterized protein FOMMEDRAFT_104330 [Fomitiporia mediterranea MF3/22]|uniref:uncharacterized protein n=1 Tax=Fomitiporia mediterranea (strain MF3/22) TaxID=694068 RepID=UPI0004409662|nr:uncharacterized protein FOMMEDRAFT_104330 [Fomitiporia mediterranea MF3/22]EJD05952.1 hypothetical protein FOMMEDRAFT_104330 [Fomitiporia mediterranea MF3/22]
MSASSPPLVVNVMNGRPHSQNSSSSSTTTTSTYAGGARTPSSNDGVGQVEQNGTATTATSASVQQNAPPGQDGGYAVAGPSSAPVNGFTSNVYAPSHNEQIIDHLYNAGFQMGEYADTLLHAHGHRYQLHAIILSRSPYLAHLISANPKSAGMHSIYVPLESFPEITDQGFAVALGYLYSSVSLNNLTTANARAVLSAGCLLGGMDELCNYAYQACRNSISVENINEWIEFVDNLSTSDGTATPSEAQQQRPSILGPYALQLRSDVFNFLVVTLTSILDVHSPSGSGRNTLLGIFARLGFDLFKSAIESPMFQIGTDQERFRFAKNAIELRKRTRGAGVDEAVVLAFGGGHSGSAVHVTRKTKKRALYKVG